MRRLLSIAFSVAVLLVVPSALWGTPSYSAVFVFGDSYCDVGNIYIATSHTTPMSPPYFDGRFSNGRIWVDHVAGYLGLPMNPSLAGGTDYAVGGAWMTAPQVLAGGTIPDVPEQVAEYLLAHGGKADGNALYILEGGGNDILGNLASGASPTDLGYKIAAGIAGSELLLRQAGARHFVIPNLFNVGLLPAAQANPGFASAASGAANKALSTLLAAEELLEGVHIVQLDIFSLLNAVERDTSHFGFKNLTTPCLNAKTGTVCADPNETLFWDIEHPTKFLHAYFAVAVEVALGMEK